MPLSDSDNALIRLRVFTDVQSERFRQVHVEKFYAVHDDNHDAGELAKASACYALHSAGGQRTVQDLPMLWPWSACWWKPKSPRQDLVRAAALLLAEIERLDRAEARK
jgi:hypothetical protein